MELSKVIGQALFATSKTGLDIPYENLYIWVFSRVHEQFWLSNTRGQSILCRAQSSGQCPFYKRMFGTIGRKISLIRFQSFLIHFQIQQMFLYFYILFHKRW